MPQAGIYEKKNCCILLQPNGFFFIKETIVGFVLKLDKITFPTINMHIVQVNVLLLDKGVVMFILYLNYCAAL